MNEKVLGFKMRTVAPYTVLHKVETIEGKRLLQVPEDKLVPVVSIEWLEKWCEKNAIAFPITLAHEKHTHTRFVRLEDLILASKEVALKR